MVIDLWTKLLMIANCYDMLYSRKEGREHMGLYNLTGLLTHDDLALNMLRDCNVLRQTSCSNPNYLSGLQNSSLYFTMAVFQVLMQFPRSL